jgi:predicted TIM-barrel fold metal-dependent hydrolase
MSGVPRLISVDDHVLEPPDLWWSRLPRKVRDRAPQVRREKGRLLEALYGRWQTDDDGIWADVWHYDDMVRPLQRGLAQSGYYNEETSRPITYEDVLPGAYRRDARLTEMDRNHTDVSICFPSVSRFCGQTFLERRDKDLALLCVRSYNDWIIEEWCAAGTHPVRLVPLTLVPLWDVELATAEVRRCADKGAHAVSFPEGAPALGLPSIYSDYWDPLFAACQETDTVLNLHVGSSSTRVTTAPDAPIDLAICFLFVNSQLAFADWLYSGAFERFPDLRVVLSEGQVGWMPFVAQRVDYTWQKCLDGNQPAGRRARQLPSRLLDGHIFGSIFDDLQGLLAREAVGMERIMIETDFPHKDSTYPHSEKVVSELVTAAGLDEQEIQMLTRRNAIAVYGLDRYFGITA